MSDTFCCLEALETIDARRISIIDPRGQHSYGALRGAAYGIAHTLLAGRQDLGQKKIALLSPPGLEFVSGLWGIWQAGGTAVPLCGSHPVPELEYVMADACVGALLFHTSCEKTARLLVGKGDIELHPLSEPHSAEQRAWPDLGADRDALVLYTSGTTSKPKGALSTHANLTAQMDALIETWGWNAADHILHVLPLHHTHGLINALLCPMRVGASCEMLPSFDPATVWEGLSTDQVTIFMAVPTIYVKLIQYWENADPEIQDRLSRAAARLRLMVSGSAALPQKVFEQWKQITGHSLLERYGMTEIGMALSNPLEGARRPGTVGTPLPGVEVRLVDESGQLVREGQPGEIQVRGASVFKEYLGRSEATSKAFVEGWFRTGDLAMVDGGYYRILGRISQDIIKTGGYKISALEIEEVLRTHPLVRECAVVGIPDEKWGERVAAAVSLRSEEPLSLEQLRGWARNRLAKYKIPSRLILLEELPRNVMGKIIKSELTTLFD